MGKRNILIVGVILFLGAVIAAYIFFYESSEECFVREMREWAVNEGVLEDVQGIIQTNTKLSVAKAKVLMKETNFNNLNDESQKIYLQVGTYFEYCGVEQ